LRDIIMFHHVPKKAAYLTNFLLQFSSNRIVLINWVATEW